MNSNLTDYRKKAGLTQEALAARLNVRAPAICRWERGVRKIPAERCADISAEIGIPKHLLRPDIFEEITP